MGGILKRRRLRGELGVTKPILLTTGVAAMDHATAARPLPATHFATSLFPLTVGLIPVITQIGRLIVPFRRADLDPKPPTSSRPSCTSYSANSGGSSSNGP